MSPGSSDEASRPHQATVIDVAVLSERRAQRAESAELALAERAAAAERAVVSMEKRLSEAETRLAAVEAERAALGAELTRRDRALITAHQREFAEQQVRLEIEAELAVIQQAAEDEIADLRSRLAAAEHAVSRLDAEVALGREETAAAEAVAARDRETAAELVAQQQALDERLTAFVRRMAALRDEVARAQAVLERRLVTEIAARESAEAWVEAHRAGAKEAGAIERGRAAKLIAAERERAAALVAIQRGRADAEATARRSAEAELAQLRGGEAPARPPSDADHADLQDARARAVQAEIARLHALRAADPAPAGPAAGSTVPASDLILDLGRAAERLRAQVAETDLDEPVRPPRRQWWRPSWWRARKHRDQAR